MIAYDEYKVSSCDWIETIPKQWQIQRIKHLFKLRDERNYSPLSDVNLISLYSSVGVQQHKDIEHTTGNKAQNADGYKIVHPNDIVVNILLCWMGAIGRSEYYGVTSPAYDIYMPIIPLHTKYYHYLFRTALFSCQCYRAGKGIMSMRWRTYSPQFSNITVPVPPREEQEQIVRFLDWKVSAIDKLIATKKHQLCSLTALNSTMEKNLVLLGFDAAYHKNPPSADWKENIPAHWKIRPLKRIFKILSGATPKSEIPEYWDGNIAWITPADYKTQDKYISHGSRNITEAGYASCSTNMIPRGSIIFSKRAPIGTVAINDIELCTNQGCLSCIPIKDASATYYYYLMSCFTDVFEMNASGTTFKEISATTFGNMKVPFPPINEQKKIAAYLDAKHTKYARFAETTQKEIIVLNELKTRLISDAVTGKIDVRSIKLPNFAKEE